MLAHEQTVPRTKVIETISRYSPKPCHRDRISSSVFHFCLRASNDDEM